MNPSKSPISGRQITRKEALKGLGDPKKWKRESDAVYAEFQAKPKQKKSRLTLFESVKTKVNKLPVTVPVRHGTGRAYAKAGHKTGLKKKKARKQPSARKKHRD